MHVALETTLALPGVRIFLATGVLGGLTTYSTFNYETLTLASGGAWSLATVNVGVAVPGCLVAGMLGVASGRMLIDAP